MPDADALVVYDWTTALAAAALPEGCGRRFYLVQADEALLGAPPKLVEQSLRLPYCRIVVSTALKRTLADRYGLAAEGPVVNGVDLEQFHVDGDGTGQRVGMVYWRLRYKASQDGLRAVELARREHPDLRLVLFGRDLPDACLLTKAEFHYDPPQKALRRIYSSCGIWLSPSRVEGSGMPVQEAMACGCAVIATDCGAVRDFGRHGENLLIVPPGDVEGMAAHIAALAADEGRRRRIADAAAASMRACTWERAAAQLEAIIARHARLQ